MATTAEIEALALMAKAVHARLDVDFPATTATQLAVPIISALAARYLSRAARTAPPPGEVWDPDAPQKLMDVVPDTPEGVPS